MLLLHSLNLLGKFMGAILLQTMSGLPDVEITISGESDGRP